jgi:hypothetical protein
MRRPCLSELAIVLAYCGLAVIPYWSYWHAGGTMIAGKGGDPATDAWFLAWVPYAVLHGHNPLVTDWGNYPAGVNAITGIGMPLLGVLGAPVTLAFGAFVTTMVFFTLAFPLSAVAAYVLVRQWVSWRPAAFAGGLLYGFSPYLVAHGSSHLNLVFVPIPPLIFLVLYRIACAGSGYGWLGWGLALGGLCVAQFLISPEVLASTVVVGCLGLCVAVLAGGRAGWAAVRERWRSVLGGAGVAVLFAAACLAYPVWLLVAGPAHVPGPVQNTSLYRGNLLGTIIPGSAMYFRTASSARLADTFSGGSENGLYLGVPLLILLLLGALFLWRRRVPVRVVAVVTVLAFVLSLGSRLVVGHHVYTSVPLPETFFNRVPLLNSTIAARYALYVMLGAAAMLAMVLEAVHSRLRSAVLGAVGPAVLALAALVPLLPSWPYWLTGTQVPPYFTSASRPAALAAHIPEGSVAVTYPFPLPRDADPMLWQVAAGMRFKSPGGRFVAPLPPAVGESVAGVFSFLSSGRPVARTPALRADLTAQLLAWHVRTVLVQAAAGGQPSVVTQFFTWLLGRPPDATTGGISAWYGSVLAGGSGGDLGAVESGLHGGG